MNKVGKVVRKLGRDVLSANVVLRVVKYPENQSHSSNIKPDSHIAEVTVGFKGGAVLVASERTDDMYASIDLLSHKLAQSMKKHNEKVHDNTRNRKERAAYKTADLDDIGDTVEFDEEELLVELDKKYRTFTKV
jgi:putative sigma-54 modulation protein